MNQISNVIPLYEPDAALRADFANSLAAAGWTVEVAATWDELLQLKPVSPPRLVVVGLGAETSSPDLAPLVAQHSRAQMIVLAVAPGKELLLEWFHVGVRDVLPRPVDADVLVAVCGPYQSAVAGRATPAEPSTADRSMLSRAIHVLLDILEARDRQCVREAKESADLCVRIGTVLDCRRGRCSRCDLASCCTTLAASVCATKSSPRAAPPARWNRLTWPRTSLSARRSSLN